jgi:hypothetical protein
MKAILIIALCCFCGHATSQSIEWQKLYGGSGSDLGQRIMQLQDGGYLMASFTYSTDGDLAGNAEGRNIWLLKLDGAGEIIWQEWYGTIPHGSARLDVKPVSDGYVIVTSVLEEALDVDCVIMNMTGWVFKVDEVGEMVWQKCFGGSLDDNSNSIEPTADGGYIICGGSTSNDGDLPGNNGFGDVWVFKITAEGDLTWSRNYGGSNIEGSRSVIHVSTGGYLVAANIRSSDLFFEGCNTYDQFGTTAAIIRLDAEGDVIWVRCLGGNGIDFLHRLSEASDGTFWIVGTTRSQDGDIEGHHGDLDGWVIRLDQQGEVLGQKVFGGSGYDDFRDFQIMPDGRVLIAGFSTSSDGDVINNYGSSDIWMLIVNDDLEVVWQKIYGGSAFEIMHSVSLTDDGGFIFSGGSTSTDGDLPANNEGANVWVVKVGPLETGLADEKIEEKPEIILFPNPATDMIHIQFNRTALKEYRLDVFDVLGRNALNGKLTPAGGKASINIADLARGTYLLRLSQHGSVINRTFIKH